MSAHNVCHVGRVVIALDFANALTISESTAMELTAFLVIRVPQCVKVLCGHAVLQRRFESLVHCRTEAASNVLRVLLVEPAVLAITALLNEFLAVALHTVIVGMDPSLVDSNERFVGVFTKLVTSVEGVEHLCEFGVFRERKNVFERCRRWERGVVDVVARDSCTVLCGIGGF